MQNYDGVPERALFDRDNFNVKSDEELPQITFTSNMGPLDLPPIDKDYCKEYQRMHWQLEGWAIFRALP